MIANPICDTCKHFCLNHGEGTGIGCRAFPDGIPENVGSSHSAHISGQVGDYVYERVSYEELPEGTKWIWDKAREIGQPF